MNQTRYITYACSLFVEVKLELLLNLRLPLETFVYCVVTLKTIYNNNGTHILQVAMATKAVMTDGHNKK